MVWMTEQQGLNVLSQNGGLQGFAPALEWKVGVRKDRRTEVQAMSSVAGADAQGGHDGRACSCREFPGPWSEQGGSTQKRSWTKALAAPSIERDGEDAVALEGAIQVPGRVFNGDKARRQTILVDLPGGAGLAIEPGRAHVRSPLVFGGGKSPRRELGEVVAKKRN